MEGRTTANNPRITINNSTCLLLRVFEAGKPRQNTIEFRDRNSRNRFSRTDPKSKTHSLSFYPLRLSLVFGEIGMTSLALSVRQLDFLSIGGALGGALLGSFHPLLSYLYHIHVVMVWSAGESHVEVDVVIPIFMNSTPRPLVTLPCPPFLFLSCLPRFWMQEFRCPKPKSII